MASSSSSPPQPDHAKTLRLIPWISIGFSFALGIPYAAACHRIVPAIGIIFLAISCTISLLDRRGTSSVLRRVLFGPKYEYRIVLGNEDDGEGSHKPINPVLLLLGDVVMAFITGLFFSLTIVEMVSGGRWGHDDILGAYASMPYLATFLSHAVLALMAMYKLAKTRRPKVAECPHCHKSVTFGRGGQALNVPQTTAQVVEQDSPKMTGASVASSESLVEA